MFDRSASNAEHFEDFLHATRRCFSQRSPAFGALFAAFSVLLYRTLDQPICEPRVAASDSLENVAMTWKECTESLALRPREAAKALGVSERSLWEWTHRGEIPHVRVGRSVLYPVDGLRDWLNRRAETVKGGDNDPR